MKSETTINLNEMASEHLIFTLKINGKTTFKIKMLLLRFNLWMIQRMFKKVSVEVTDQP